MAYKNCSTPIIKSHHGQICLITLLDDKSILKRRFPLHGHGSAINQEDENIPFPLHMLLWVMNKQAELRVPRERAGELVEGRCSDKGARCIVELIDFALK